MKTIPTFVLATLITALVGCGSDGAGPVAAIGQRLSPADTEGITFAYNPAPLPISESEKIRIDESNALEFARLALVKATAYAFNAQINTDNLQSAENFFQEADNEQTQSCAQGGNLRVSRADQNNNGLIDSKDIFALAFSDCLNSNGVLQTDYDSYTGSAVSGVLTTNSYVTARNFKGTQPSTGSSAESQGTEGRRIILGSGRYQYIVHAPNTQIQENEAGKGTASYTALTYLDIQGNRQAADSTQVRMNYREKGDVSTRLEIAPEKAYTAQSEGLSVSLRDNAVSDGTLTIQSDGRVLLVALGNSSGRYRVRISLDSNSDGVNERSCDFDYSQVLSGTASFASAECNAVAPDGESLPLVSGLPLVGPLLNGLIFGSARQ